MYARSTIDHYAANLPEPERQGFLQAIEGLRWETHGKVEVILEDTLREADLGKHVAALEKNSRWLFLTNTGDELNTVYALRYERRQA